MSISTQVLQRQIQAAQKSLEDAKNNFDKKPSQANRDKLMTSANSAEKELRTFEQKAIGIIRSEPNEGTKVLEGCANIRAASAINKQTHSKGAPLTAEETKAAPLREIQKLNITMDGKYLAANELANRTPQSAGLVSDINKVFERQIHMLEKAQFGHVLENEGTRLDAERANITRQMKSNPMTTEIEQYAKDNARLSLNYLRSDPNYNKSQEKPFLQERIVTLEKQMRTETDPNAKQLMQAEIVANNGEIRELRHEVGREVAAKFSQDDLKSIVTQYENARAGPLSVNPAPANLDALLAGLLDQLKADVQNKLGPGYDVGVLSSKGNNTILLITDKANDEKCIFKIAKLDDEVVKNKRDYITAVSNGPEIPELAKIYATATTMNVQSQGEWIAAELSEYITGKNLLERHQDYAAKHDIPAEPTPGVLLNHQLQVLNDTEKVIKITETLNANNIRNPDLKATNILTDELNHVRISDMKNMQKMPANQTTLPTREVTTTYKLPHISSKVNGKFLTDLDKVDAMNVGMTTLSMMTADPANPANTFADTIKVHTNENHNHFQTDTGKEIRAMCDDLCKGTMTISQASAAIPQIRNNVTQQLAQLYANQPFTADEDKQLQRARHDVHSLRSGIENGDAASTIKYVKALDQLAERVETQTGARSEYSTPVQDAQLKKFADYHQSRTNQFSDEISRARTAAPIPDANINNDVHANHGMRQ